MPGRRKRRAGPMKWEEAGPFEGLCPIFEHNEGGCKGEWAGAGSQIAFWAKGMNLDFFFLSSLGNYWRVLSRKVHLKQSLSLLQSLAGQEGRLSDQGGGF